MLCHVCDGRTENSLIYCPECIDRAEGIIQDKKGSIDDDLMREQALALLASKIKQRWEKYNKKYKEWVNDGSRAGEGPVPEVIKLPKRPQGFWCKKCKNADYTIIGKEEQVCSNCGYDNTPKKGENMICDKKEPDSIGELRIEGVSDIAQSAVREVLEGEKEEDYKEQYNLMVAARAGDIENIKLSISEGAEVDWQNMQGNTALIVAVAENQPEAVKVLLFSGANPDIQNTGGQDALSVAVTWKREKIIALLEQAKDMPATHKPKSWPYKDIEWKHKDCPNCKKERDFTYNKVKDIYHCNYCCVKFRPHELEEKKEGKIKVKKSEEEKPLKNLCSCGREIEWGQAYCPDCSKDFCLVEVEPEVFQSVKKETGTFKRLREVFQSEELIEISEVQILGNTTRREVDDNKVNELANSIKEIGLLNPITITPGKILIAGLHRMKAFILLGETEIPCRIVNLTDLEAELAEIDENLIRNELDYIDRGTQYQRRQGIYEQLYPETKKGAVNQYTKVLNAESALSKNSFVEDTSRKTGKSSRVIQEELQISKKVIPEAKTVLKEKDIPKTEALKLSRKTPEEQKQIIDKIQSGEAATVKQAIRQEKREKFFTPDIPLPKEEFNLILADPPWQHDNQASRGAAQDHYPTMNLQDIKDLGKKLPAAEDSICFLWAVNSMLPEALETLQAWGYKYKTNCVWTKPSIGVGNWVRTQHELLLIGVMGNFPTPAEADRKSSIITGKSTEHSKKPEMSYELIETMYPGAKKLELFSREKRDGWIAWGSEV